MPVDSGGVRDDSDAMALIRDRFNRGELLVGGTSAGTAVQGGCSLHDDGFTIPMIDGGQARSVLVSGYDEGIAVFEGGLGLFSYGITDSHFSERARETRLVKLAQQQGVRFGLVWVKPRPYWYVAGFETMALNKRGCRCWAPAAFISPTWAVLPCCLATTARWRWSK